MTTTKQVIHGNRNTWTLHHCRPDIRPGPAGDTVSPLERLRHHVTGAIERGESVAIVSHELPANVRRDRTWVVFDYLGGTYRASESLDRIESLAAMKWSLTYSARIRTAARFAVSEVRS